MPCGSTGAYSDSFGLDAVRRDIAAYINARDEAELADYLSSPQGTCTSSHTHTHTHTLSLSLSHALTHSLALSHLSIALNGPLPLSDSNRQAVTVS